MNRSFPALRGVAILLVILNHTIYMVTEYATRAAESGAIAISAEDPLFRILSVVSGLGVYAVPIFLFLSGCFFAYAGGRKDLQSDYKIVWTNIKHVGIPYLIWSLIFYLEIFVLHGERSSPGGYIKNLLVGYPFNFVPLLIFCYVISPLIIRAMRRYGIWVLVLIGVYQLFLLAVVSPRDAGFQVPGFLHILAPPVLSKPLAEWGLWFPLGLYMVQIGGRGAEFASRYRWGLILAVVLFFALGTLDALKVLEAPAIRQITPLPFLLLSAAFQRSSFPAVRSFELLGKRAYGLYLMNLLTLDMSLYAVQAAATGVLAYVLPLLLVMFTLALFIPLLLMTVLERRMKPLFFRYAFG